MNNLEKFIRNNRKEMDVYDPDPGIWNRINERSRNKKANIRVWFSIAALIVIILVTAVAFFNIRHIRNSVNIGENTLLTGTNPGLKETEFYYNTLVNFVCHEVTLLLIGHPDIDKELQTDMFHIDSICLLLKNDLKDNIANKEIIEALIQNYRIKIQLLEDMLKFLNQNVDTTETNKSHEL